MGKVKSLTAGDQTLIDFNPYGVASGWCSWPVNFDPTWVDCRLDIEKIQQALKESENAGRSEPEQTGE